MSYETGDIKQAIKDYYERKIEENNLVYKGQTIRINKLHEWRDEDLGKLNALEKKARAFDQISDKLETYDCEAHDSLNVNYHDFGADTAHVVDEMVGGFWDE